VKDQGMNKAGMLGLLAGVGAALLWGVWPTISRFGVQSTLHPSDIVFIRFAVSGLVLLPVFLRFRLKGVPFKGALLLMTGAGAPYVIITVIGLTYTPAIHGGLVVPSFNIIFSTIGAAYFLGTRPTSTRLIGLSLILLGCGMIFAESLSGTDMSQLKGDLLYVLGGFVYAIYTVSNQKYGISAWHAAAIVAVFSAILYIPVYILFLPHGLAEASLSEIAIQAVFQGVVTSIMAIFLFSTAITYLGAARAVVFLALMPVFTLVSAIPILGELPTDLETLALATIVIGTLVAVEIVRKPFAIFRRKSPAELP
jgi:drug/metabolite transporter (DMT)-like permease